MANNTIKFDIKAAVDTGGLDEFVSQLRQLKDVAEPADRILGQAVKEIKAWAESARLSERNTAAATTAIRALSTAMTAGGSEWKKAIQVGNGLNKTLRETTSAATAAKAALAAPARTTIGASQQIADMRKGLQDLTIGSQQYLNLLQQITEKEALLGRRTGRAGVVAANQAFEGALLTRGYGAPDRLQEMPNTTAALRQRLSELGEALPNLIRGEREYIAAAREMRQIEQELARDVSRSIEQTNALAAARQRLASATSLNRSSSGSGFAAWSSSVNDRIDINNAIEQYRAEQAAARQQALDAVRSRRGEASQNAAYSSNSGFGAFSRDIAGQEQVLRRGYNDLGVQFQPAAPSPQVQFLGGTSMAPTELFRSIGGIDTAGATAKLQTMGRSYEQVAQQIRDTAQAAGGSTRALQAERQAWEQLQASVAPASREYRQAGREMQRLDRQMGASRRGERFLESAGAISAGAFFGGPEGLAGGLLGMAVGGPGAALGGASIGAQVGIVRKGVGDMATYAAEVGKLRIALKGVVADNEQYAKSLEVVSNVSTQLNIPVQEATQGFTRLAAAVVGAGGNVGDAEVVFRGVSSAVKATGGNAQDAQSAMLALSQVFSKGKVSAEELQGQLGERLPGAVTLFAQATGRTLPQLAKDLEQGTVGLNDLMKFTELLSSKYAANALRIAKSTEDSGARQAVALANLREEFGKTFLPLGGMLQDGISAWAEYATGAIKSINDIVGRYEFLRETLKVGGIGLVGLTPVVGPVLAGMMAGGRSDQGPQGRLAAAGSTTMYSDAQGNVYDAATGKLLLPSGRSQTSFADPKGSSDDEERKKREREEKQRLNEAAQRERLGLQLFNDEVRRQEQLAENRIRLEDRIFQHRQELMRRERDQQLQLDQLRQQTLITSLSPEGRAAAGPIQEFLQGLQDFSRNRQELLDRVSAAEQAVKSAEANAQNVGRFTPIYQPDDQSQQNTPAGNLQSSRPSIGNQFLSQILGNQFEDVAGLQPLPLERMYRQMGRQVRRWTDMIQNEARYILKRDFGTDKPLIPQDIIDKTVDRVRTLTNTIQGFDPLELQFRELQNRARGSSGQARSQPSSISLTAFGDIFSKIERRVIIDAANSLNQAGGYLGELGRNADLSDFLPENTKKFLADGIRQIVSNDEGGFKRKALERTFSRNFSSFFQGTTDLVDFERNRSAPTRSGAGGYDSLDLPGVNRTPSGGVDYLRQYRELQELMEPPRITPGVQNQFDGASLIPLLKKFESVASSGFIPVSIENPDVIAQALMSGGARTNRLPDRDAEATGWDIVHPGGRGGSVRAPIDLTITGTGFQGRGAGPTGRGYGNWITGEFELGGKKYELLLGHFDQVDVAPGMRVPAGAQLGTQGITGRAIGAHTTTHVNPKSGASVQDAWNALEQLTRKWERGGFVSTLANGREIRTPGATAAAMRGMEAAGRVDDAKANLKQARDELALFDRDLPALKDLSAKLGIERTIQSLKDQEIALRDNYKEWKIRNRLQLEGVKPELIDFEINRERLLEQQKRQLSDMSRLVEVLGPDLDKIGKGDVFRVFINQGKAEIERRTATNIAIQRDMAQAAVDPYLEWQNKMNALGQSTRDFNDTLKLGMSLSDQFTGNLANGFSTAASAIVTGNGSIQQSFADLFNNIAKMFLDTIARVLADQLTMQFLELLQPATGLNQYTSIISGLISSFGSGIGGNLGGSGFGDLGGSVAGNFAPGLPQLASSGITGTMLSGFATGGISAGPTSGYPVMLHGTEAVIPLPNGRAVPVEMKGSGGTSVVVNVNMSTGESSVSSNERDGQLLGKALSEAVQAELVRQKRPGGILYG